MSNFMFNKEFFIEEILSVCKKHRVSISHEDSHGSFIIEKYNEDRSDWLRDAYTEFPEGDKSNG